MLQLHILAVREDWNIWIFYFLQRNGSWMVDVSVCCSEGHSIDLIDGNSRCYYQAHLNWCFLAAFVLSIEWNNVFCISLCLDFYEFLFFWSHLCPDISCLKLQSYLWLAAPWKIDMDPESKNFGKGIMLLWDYIFV